MHQCEIDTHRFKTHLTSPSVNFTFGEPSAGGRMSKVERTAASKIKTEFSAKYLPGQILIIPHLSSCGREWESTHRLAKPNAYELGSMGRSSSHETRKRSGINSFGSYGPIFSKAIAL